MPYPVGTRIRTDSHYPELGDRIGTIIYNSMTTDASDVDFGEGSTCIIYQSCMILVDEEAETSLSQFISDAEYERLLSSDQTTPDCLVVGNVAYNLASGREIKGFADILLSKLQENRRILDAARKSLQDKYERERQQFQRVLPAPAYSSKDKEQGMQLTIDPPYITYRCPFSYAPDRITCQGGTFKLTEAHAKRLKTEVTLELHTRFGIIEVVRLLNEQGRIFKHFHCMGDYDCTGSLERPKIFSAADAWAFRDAYQNVLHTINRDSPGDEGCRGISLNECWDKAKEQGEAPPEGWALPAPESLEGKLVVITQGFEQIPPSWEGRVVAKVVYDSPADDSYNALLEFGFTTPFFHSTLNRGGPANRYWVPRNRFALAPSRRRLTRRTPGRNNDG